MLYAFKSHLKDLARDPKDLFHVKVRKRVGKKATLLLEKRLRQLILIMPDIVERAHLLWRQFPADAPAKKASGYLLTYLYHPRDFLSEEDHGLFGYLDDAYFAALIYEFVLGSLKEAGTPLTLNDKRFLKDIANMKAAAKLVIPIESKKIEDMFQEIQNNEQSVLFTAAFAA